MNRINITMPDNILKKIDSFAEQNNKSRSEFVRSLVRMYEEFIIEDKRRKRNISRAISIQDVLRNSSSKWDAVTVLRKQRKKNK